MPWVTIKGKHVLIGEDAGVPRPGAKYEMKKVLVKKTGKKYWAILDKNRPVSFHGDRQGAKVALAHLQGADPLKLSKAIEKQNARWMKGAFGSMLK